MQKRRSAKIAWGRVFWLFGLCLGLLGLLALWSSSFRSAPSVDDKSFVDQAFTRLVAYSQYVQGRNSWARRDETSIRRAIVFFRKAIGLDSTMAVAYSGLADCYTALGYGSYEPPAKVFPVADSAARRALKLDSSLADPHASLAYIQFYYHWDWARAEKEFIKAIQLNAHYEWTYDSYGYFLTARERFSEASVAMEQAIQLNPLSAQINTDAGFSLYYSGRSAQAIRPLQTAVAINSRNPLAHLWLGRAYQQLKNYEGAITQYKISLSLNRNWPPGLGALGNVYAEAGQPEKARAVLDSLLAMQNKRFVTPYAVALVYSALKDRENAFGWLEKAYTERSNWLVWLKLDPRWSGVLADPRYAKLVTQIGLTHE